VQVQVEHGLARAGAVVDREAEGLADAELRSVNAEIEVLLREALARRGVKVARSGTPRRGRPPGSSNEGGNGAG